MNNMKKEFDKPLGLVTVVLYVKWNRSDYSSPADVRVIRA
jgi:hypothetical protein